MDEKDIDLTMSNNVYASAITICLNMIVKNESKIIVRLLESVTPLIDEYCICDTGSTDDTIALITAFFSERGIPGHIINKSFRDFGYNRSFALSECNRLSNTDYIIFMDADMILKIGNTDTILELKNRLTADAYYIFQGSDQFFYKNVRILRNVPGYSYWGVTHEYVKSPNNAKYDMLDRTTLFISDIGDGGSKSDKQDRDIRLLKQGLVDFPNNDRYTFYLANSYRDNWQNTEAIEYYKKRIALQGWGEECWFSMYSIGKCYYTMNNYAEAIYWWMEAYNHTPGRVEALYEIIRHYRIKGNNRMAYHLYMLADRERKNMVDWDALFMHKDIYDYKLDYELSVIGYYCNLDNHNLERVSMRVLENPGVDKYISCNVLSNYKFYAKQLIKYSLPISSNNTYLLESIGMDLLAPYIGEFVASTPTLCIGQDNTLMIIRRFVNYKINDIGEYINQEFIETKNVIARINTQNSEWIILDQRVIEYDRSHDNKYIGLEDIRLFCPNMKNSEIYYNANRGIKQNNRIMAVEFGKIDIEKGECCECGILMYDNQTDIEKNWVLFPSSDNIPKCVYKWNPLTLGNINVDNNQFIVSHQISTPPFFQFLRGSTNGILVNNEIWFIAHVVSYEDRRYYYHIVVVLDSITFGLKRHTPLFTFEGHKVEYTLGFQYYKSTDKFLIGYSIMDRETKYITVSKHIFDNMCKDV
jgi:tetratricopeptide (TPR) repeat protein